VIARGANAAGAGARNRVRNSEGGGARASGASSAACFEARNGGANRCSFPCARAVISTSRTAQRATARGQREPRASRRHAYSPEGGSASPPIHSVGSDDRAVAEAIVSAVAAGASSWAIPQVERRRQRHAVDCCFPASVLEAQWITASSPVFPAVRAREDARFDRVRGRAVAKEVSAPQGANQGVRRHEAREPGTTSS
jgi:hypothetical protein